MRVRGSYDLDPESNNLIWQPIGGAWNDNEIEEFRLLSNVSYRLYEKAVEVPKFVLFFGAGASYGSGGKHLHEGGLLPPLGHALYPKLRDAPELKYWNDLPNDITEIFLNESFEAGMFALDQSKDGPRKSLWRDIELALFFSRYRPEPANLYWKLASRISRRLSRGWSGAVITLNYERLLEESFMRNTVFTVVKGVTFYDEDYLPEISDDQIIEVCYPHGGCQFFLGQAWIAGEGDIVFADAAKYAGNVGATHILSWPRISIACQDRQIPIICRYQENKRPSVNNYFIVGQKERAQQMIAKAEIVTIVGVQCYETDKHIWGPLADTAAKLIYVEPGELGQERFRAWALVNGKQEGCDFQIIRKTFKDAFDEIVARNDL
jgi:hypothetical protein